MSNSLWTCFSQSHRKIKSSDSRDFPGGPVVETLPSSAGSAGSILGQGAEIPHVLQPKSQNIKQMQYCNTFNKDFKVKVAQSCLTLYDPHSPGQNTGVGTLRFSRGSSQPRD